MRHRDVIMAELDDWEGVCVEPADDRALEVARGWVDALLYALDRNDEKVRVELDTMPLYSKASGTSRAYYTAFREALRWVMQDWDRMPDPKHETDKPDNDIPFFEVKQ